MFYKILGLKSTLHTSASSYITWASEKSVLFSVWQSQRKGAGALTAGWEGGRERRLAQHSHTLPSQIFQTFKRLLKAATSSWRKSFTQMASRPNMSSDGKWGAGPSVHTRAKEHKLNHGICHLKWLHHSWSGFLLVYSQRYGVSSPSWSKVKTQGLGPGRHKFMDLWKQYLKKEKARKTLESRRLWFTSLHPFRSRSPSPTRCPSIQ